MKQKKIYGNTVLLLQKHVYMKALSVVCGSSAHYTLTSGKMCQQTVLTAHR